MKPIEMWRTAGLTALSLALLATLFACDSGSPRSAETDRAARAAAESTRAASAIAAAEVPAGDGKTAAVPASPTGGASLIPPSEQGEDALISAKVTTGLAIDRTLRSSHIEVATRAGVVTLKGPAPSPAARARAEEIARNVQGVTAVENRLSVQPG